MSPQGSLFLGEADIPPGVPRLHDDENVRLDLELFRFNRVLGGVDVPSPPSPNRMCIS